MILNYSEVECKKKKKNLSERERDSLTHCEENFSMYDLCKSNLNQAMMIYLFVFNTYVCHTLLDKKKHSTDDVYFLKKLIQFKNVMVTETVLASLLLISYILIDKV